VGSTCPGAFASTRTLGPTAANLLKQFPAPVPVTNFSSQGGGEVGFLGGPGITYPVNIFGQVDIRDQTKFNENRLSFKVDHNMSSRDRLSGVYAFDDFDTTDSSLGTDENPGGSPYFPNINFARSQNAGLNYTHIFSSTLLNEARISYLRYNLT